MSEPGYIVGAVMGRVRRSRSVVDVVVYPAATNPYQALLYDRTNVAVHYVRGPKSRARRTVELPILITRLLVARAQGIRLLHLHWTYPLVSGVQRPKVLGRALSSLQIQGFLLFLRLVRFALVWTVHDLLPHRQETLSDVGVACRLSRQSAAICILSRRTLDSMRELGVPVEERKVFITPHGNYVGCYPDVISSSEARARLGVGSDVFAFLLFGRLDGYKNVIGLLDAFRRMSEEDSDALLIVAGDLIDRSLMPALEAASEWSSGRVVVRLGHVPADDIQVLYRAADIAVHPFTAVTNSGSVMLSLSFGVPVIVPRLGALQDIPGDAAIGYEPERSSVELVQALRAARSRDLGAMSNAALRYASGQSWAIAAKEVEAAYAFALGRMRQGEGASD